MNILSYASSTSCSCTSESVSSCLLPSIKPVMRGAGTGLGVILVGKGLADAMDQSVDAEGNKKNSFVKGLAEVVGGGALAALSAVGMKGRHVG